MSEEIIKVKNKKILAAMKSSHAAIMELQFWNAVTQFRWEKTQRIIREEIPELEETAWHSNVTAKTIRVMHD